MNRQVQLYNSVPQQAARRKDLLWAAVVVVMASTSLGALRLDDACG